MSKKNKKTKSVYSKVKKSLPMLDPDQINELIDTTQNLIDYDLNVGSEQKAKIYESAISLLFANKINKEA